MSEQAVDSVMAKLKPKLEKTIDLAIQATARVLEITSTLGDMTERRAAQSMVMASIFNNCMDIIMADIKLIMKDEY